MGLLCLSSVPSPALLQGTLPLFSSMNLSALNLKPGIGVRHHFGEPVNFFPIQGLKEFFLIFWWAVASYVSVKFILATFFRPLLGVLWLISGPSRFLTEFFNLSRPLRMWVFKSTSCNLSRVINIKSSLICGDMEAPIG